jgi:hypothetical protein
MTREIMSWVLVVLIPLGYFCWVYLPFKTVFQENKGWFVFHVFVTVMILVSLCLLKIFLSDFFAIIS